MSRTRTTHKPKQIEIWVPYLPPNPNRSSRNYYADRKAKKEFAMSVRQCAIDARNKWGNWKTLDEAEVSLRFIIPECKPGPVPDIHNLLMGVKEALDELTNRTRGNGNRQYQGIGIIEDDGANLAWGPADLLRSGDEPFTVITIKERRD